MLGNPCLCKAGKFFAFSLCSVVLILRTDIMYVHYGVHEAVSSRSDSLVQAQRIKWISAVEAEIASWLAGRDLSK